MSDPQRTGPLMGTGSQSAAKTTTTSVVDDTDRGITLDDAERLTTRIQLRLGTIADNVESVLSLIEQARAANVHEVLGYRSWTEYVAEKFGGALARIGKAERVPIVELLSGQGMSTRAIATVVGVSQPQVVRDRQVIHPVSPDVRPVVSDETPWPDGGKCQVEGHGWHGGPGCSCVPRITDETPEVLPERRLRPDEIDGLMSTGLIKDFDDLVYCMEMAAATDEEFETAITEARADDDLSRENTVAKITAIKKTAGNVTGIDGKTYTPAPPRAPRRRALPDQARDAGWDLRKSADRIGRVLADERLPANREQVCHVLRGRLRDTQDTVRDALDLLPRDEAGLEDPYEAAIKDLDAAVQRFWRVPPDEAFGSDEINRQHLKLLADALNQVADDLAEWWQ